MIEVVSKGHLTPREALEKVREVSLVTLAKMYIVGGAHVERVPQHHDVLAVGSRGREGLREVMLDEAWRAVPGAHSVRVNNLDARKLLGEEGVEVWQRFAFVEERPDYVLRQGGAGTRIGTDEDVARQRLEPEDLADLITIEAVLL